MCRLLFLLPIWNREEGERERESEREKDGKKERNGYEKRSGEKVKEENLKRRVERREEKW
jgi:hypothetical protein